MKDIYDKNGKVIATVVDHYQIQKDLQEQFERSERNRGGGGGDPSFIPMNLYILSIPAIVVLPFFLLCVKGFSAGGFGIFLAIAQWLIVRWLTFSFGEMNYHILKEPIIFIAHHISWIIFTAELYYFWKSAFIVEPFELFLEGNGNFKRILGVILGFVVMNKIIERFRKSDGY